MPNLQQAELIEFVTPQSLKPHPLNVAVYGGDGYQDLIESIKGLGVLQALYVTSKNIILSGHRRWRAAMAAECPNIPIIRMDYTNEMDERQAIIEHNRYRIKNGQQLYNEGKELERIEAERGKSRQAHGLTAPGRTLEEILPQASQAARAAQTRDVVAKAIGLGSGRQWDKLEYVQQNKPELLQEIRPDGISLSKAYIESRKQVIAANRPNVPLPKGIFNVIYADPPWEYEFAQSPSRSINAHYTTLPLNEIYDFHDINGTSIQEKINKDAVLFLWTPQTKIREALEIIARWQFEYRTGAIWIKQTSDGQPQIGMGYYFREQHELLLVAKRGNMVAPPPESRVPSTFIAPRTNHSRKPSLVRDIIKKMYPNADCLEVFGTEKVPGWTIWP